MILINNLLWRYYEYKRKGGKKNESISGFYD